jgi:hypothetical protein
MKITTTTPNHPHLMHPTTDDRVDKRTVPVVIQGEGGIQQQLVRQLVVGIPGGIVSAGGDASTLQAQHPLTSLPALLIKPIQRGASGDLDQLAPQACDLRLELPDEIGPGRLLHLRDVERVLQRHQGALDANLELLLVRPLPGVEGGQVRGQHREEVRRQHDLDTGEPTRLDYAPRDALKHLRQTNRGVHQRALHRPERLEHMRGAVGDHVQREEHPHVDRVVSCGHVAVAEDRKQVDPMEEALRSLDGAGFAKVDDELLEAVGVGRKWLEELR